MRGSLLLVFLFRPSSLDAALPAFPGGWPLLEPGGVSADSDRDGMPDAWEKANGLDPNDPADATQLCDDGYIPIERFINGLADPVVGPSTSS